jgi:hypothetical protein
VSQQCSVRRALEEEEEEDKKKQKKSKERSKFTFHS